MSIHSFTRHRGWTRLFRVFLGLWYGIYILVIVISFALDGMHDLGRDFYLLAAFWAVTPWVLVFFVRLLRYVIEGFSSESG